MAPIQHLRRDERGLVGKSIIIMLVFVVIAGIATVDTLSVLFTRLSVNDVATTVALEAARAYQRSDNQRDAQTAAVEALRDDPSVDLVGEVTVDRATGDVTVTVRKKASTLVAGKISFLKKYAIVRVTVTQGPPTA
jgi:hypothetical protein